MYRNPVHDFVTPKAEPANPERYLEQQNAGKDWTIFAVVSCSYDPAAGESITKLQAKAVPKKIATKIVKLLKS